MDKLKATLEKTHQALEEEKRRTVDLLYSIFPGDVAQRLWQGLPVQAKKFDDVTMLFSDIVGFTAVCAQCTPMQVISMLNELYTRFDYQCGILDVYKVKPHSIQLPRSHCKHLKWSLFVCFLRGVSFLRSALARRAEAICIINVNLTIKEERESLAALDRTAFVVLIISLFVMNTLKGFVHLIICLFYLNAFV